MRSRIDDLLLSFLRKGTEGRGGIDAVELSGEDWDGLLRKSARHHVAPLLYHRLTAFHPGVRVPAEILRKLRNGYLQSAGRNTHLYHDLGKILGRLQQHGIPVIALKGAHLAIAAYRNIALRPMADIDLLVHQRDLPGVQAVLVELGYAASKGEIFSAHEQLPAYRKKDSICVEVHFNITEPPFSCRVDVDKLFDRARPFLIEGTAALSLCPEDILIHLCMHASYHHGFDNGILPLFDIATVVEHYEGEIDWGEVFRRSEEWGVAKCVCLTLSLAETVAGVSIPGKSRVGMDVCSDDFNAKTAAEELLFGQGTRIMPNLARLFGNSGLREKASHFLCRAFPPKNTMSDMNPGKKNPFSFCLLYYYRIKGLLNRHGQTAWKLLLRDNEMSALAGLENRRNALKDWLIQ